MTDQEQVKAGTDLRALARFFGRKVDDVTVGDYVEVLADLKYPAFESALLVLKRDGRWFPKPREIRQAAQDVGSEQRPPWHGTTFVTQPDGDVTPVYHCLVCQDMGWAPACGCAQGDLGIVEHNGQCPQHPRLVNERTYRQAVMACACRATNPVYQARRQRPEAARFERQRGAA